MTLKYAIVIVVTGKYSILAVTFYIFYNIMWSFWYKTQSRTGNKIKGATDIYRKIVQTGKLEFRANSSCCFLSQYLSCIHYSILYFHMKEKTPCIGRPVTWRQTEFLYASTSGQLWMLTEDSNITFCLENHFGDIMSELKLIRHSLFSAQTISRKT